MFDPPRAEVRDAVERARNAGIRVIIITGDHKDTALAVAREIGLIDRDKHTQVFTEQDLLELSDKEFEKVVKNINVFARLTPTMKLRIAKTLQKQGHIIAMTGDGVNDAPALRKADVGISMGIIGQILLENLVRSYFQMITLLQLSMLLKKEEWCS